MFFPEIPHLIVLFSSLKSSPVSTPKRGNPRQLFLCLRIHSFKRRIFMGFIEKKKKNNGYYFPNLKMVVVCSATKWVHIYLLIQACIFNKIAYNRNCI